MSQDIGTNTDPLSVEIYIENGLIKGRIIMDMNLSLSLPLTSSSSYIDNKVENIYVKCSKIYTINSTFRYDFTYINMPLIKSDKIMNNVDNKYENFNYIEYMIKYKLIDSRRNIYNNYCINKLPLDIDYEYNISFTSALIKILTNARENNNSEFLIIFNNARPILSNINIYNISSSNYEFVEAKIIVSPKYIGHTIIGFNNMTIRKECYDELLENLSLFKCSWEICLVNYIDKYLFETVILENNLFEI